MTTADETAEESVDQQIARLDSFHRPLLNEAIREGNAEGASIETITEKFYQVFTHHGEQFVARKTQLGEMCDRIIRLAMRLNENKNYEVYSDYEGELLFLNDGLAIALYMIGIYDDALDAFSDALQLVIRPTMNSDIMTQRQIKVLLATYIESVERSKRWLAVIEKKQKGYEKYATHLKDFFFYEQRGAVRTT